MDTDRYYYDECSQFHRELINQDIITLDKVPQYVRIKDGGSIYTVGLKQAMYFSEKKNDRIYIHNFFALIMQHQQDTIQC